MDALFATPSDTPGPPPDPEPDGRVGRFELVRVVGQGGFGIVYLARDPRLGREVAVKTPRPDVLLTPELLKRFTREGQAAAGLDHPHIVPVYETGEDGPVPFIVSAHVPGPSLAGWLKESQQLPAPPVAAGLVADLADAVHHAHQRGVLHRDLKPANVLLDAVGDDPSLARPRLTDFGLARLAEAAGTGETGPMACLGTPSYMAPEQALGRTDETGPAADVYGLGAILYELLTGHPPFRGSNDRETMQLVATVEPVPPRRNRRAVPPDLETVCLKCLEKEPRRRYASAADLADDLRRVIREEPTVARPPGPIRRVAALARRRPQLAAFASLVVVGLTSASVTFAALAAHLRAINGQLEDYNERLNEQKIGAEKLAADLSDQNYIWGIQRAYHLIQGNHLPNAAASLARVAPAGPSERDRRGFVWWYLNRQATPGGRPLVGHVGDVHGVAFDRSGVRVASGGKDRTVRVWDVATGAEIACLRGPTSEVNGVAFHPDGQFVAAGSDDGTVWVWPAAGGVGREIGRPGAIVDEVLFSEDGAYLAATDRDGRVHVWEADTGRPVRTLPLGPSAVLTLGRKRTGELTAIAFVSGQVTMYDALTGNTIRTDPVSLYTKLVAAGTDGFWAALGDDTGRLEIRRPAAPWTLDTVRRFLAAPAGRAESLARSPNQRFLACGRRDSATLLYDLEDGGNSPAAVLRGHDGRVWGVAFSPDDRLLATAGGDGVVRLWDVAAEIAAASPYTFDAGVRDAAFVPGTHQLVVAIDNGPVKVIDLLARRELATWYPPPAERIGGLTVSPDGQLVFAGLSGGGYVRLDQPDLTPTVIGTVGDSLVTAVVATADGRVVTADSRGRVAVGTIDGVPEVIGSYTDGGPHADMAVVPGTGLVAVRGTGGEVLVLDADSRTVVRRLAGHTQTVEAVAFSPDGEWLATGSMDKTVRVWERRTGRLVTTLAASRGAVRSLAFSPDGRTLAAGGDDRAVRTWRTDTWLELIALEDHPGPVARVAFSSDGRLLAAVGRAGDGKGFVVVRDAGPR